MAKVLTSFSLAGRVVLVTGGAGHLGPAMCRGLAEAGARVLVNGRDGAKAEKLASALRAEGLAAEARPFDITDADSVARDVGRLDRLDILVNNAILAETGTIATTPATAFARVAASAAEAAYA